MSQIKYFLRNTKRKIILGVILRVTAAILSVFIINSVYAHGNKKHPTIKQNSVEKKKNETTIERPGQAKLINSEYLQNIKPIFKRACFDCHTGQTSYPWYYNVPIIKQIIDSDIKNAKKHLDFSNDYPFQSHDTPINDLKEIKNSINKGKMPPWDYKFMHSDSMLSDFEVSEINKWIDKSLILLGEGKQNEK